MAKVAESALPNLKSQIDALTSDPTGAPGVVFAAVNKQGEPIFEHASGKVGAGKNKDMTMDNVFWIASCTKMITGIACMQLVEQGKLALDDVELVEKLAPVSQPLPYPWMSPGRRL
jgi:CubicO group peptidase (beta-lactamase class C family)